MSGQPAGQSPLEVGTLLFEQLRCDTCHAAGSDQRGPTLAGIFGKDVRLKGGSVALVDEEYIRESILEPNAKIVEGYDLLTEAVKRSIPSLSEMVRYRPGS